MKTIHSANKVLSYGPKYIGWDRDANFEVHESPHRESSDVDRNRNYRPLGAWQHEYSKRDLFALLATRWMEEQLSGTAYIVRSTEFESGFESEGYVCYVFTMRLLCGLPYYAITMQYPVM